MAGGFLVLAGILCNEQPGLGLFQRRAGCFRPILFGFLRRFWTSPEAEAETSEVGGGRGIGALGHVALGWGVSECGSGW